MVIVPLTFARFQFFVDGFLTSSLQINNNKPPPGGGLESGFQRSFIMLGWTPLLAAPRKTQNNHGKWGKCPIQMTPLGKSTSKMMNPWEKGKMVFNVNIYIYRVLGKI